MILNFLFLFVCGWAFCEVVAVPKLIIISYAGFSNDHFNRNVTPFMNHLKNNHVHVDYMKNLNGKTGHSHHLSFEKDSLTEVQGFADKDGLQDPEAVKHSFEVFTYYGDIMPIWIINELSGQNRSSGLMMWPGGEFSFNGSKATHVKVYEDTAKWESRIDQIIAWFKDEVHPINLAMLYFEKPRNLTTETELDELLKEVDNATEYLYHQLTVNNLTDVNVIHISDRSRINLSNATVINITKIIGSEHYDVVGTPSTRFIKPHDEKNKQEIYGKLKGLAEITLGFDVYWSDDLPDIVHVRRSLQVNEIVVIAEKGYVFEDVVKTFAVWEETRDTRKGRHDGNNASHCEEGAMSEFQEAEELSEPKAFFFATGPAFHENCTLQPFSSADLFPLFCHVLEVSCVDAEGSVEAFEECLTKIEEHSSRDMLIAGLLIMLLFIIIIATTIFFVMRRRRQQKLHIEEYRKSQMDSTLPR